MYWVQALPGEARRSSSWTHVLRDRLVSRFDRIDPTDNTREAEDGLDLGRCAYWYVLRCDDAFTRCIVVSHPPADPSSLEGGALPFDSGGLWHGHLVADPVFDDAADRSAFAKKSHVPIDSVPAEFPSWIATSYDPPQGYVDGVAPAKSERIIAGDPNEPRAWTWEVHVRALPYVNPPSVPHQLFMHVDDADWFRTFLRDEDSELRPDEYEGLIAWLESSVRETSDPMADAAAILRGAI